MSSVVTFEPGNHSKSLGKRIDEHLYHIYIITYQRIGIPLAKAYQKRATVTRISQIMLKKTGYY